MHKSWRGASLLFAALVAFEMGMPPSAVAQRREPGSVAIGTGTVNAIHAKQRKINITHGPIPDLGWPGMTMDFPLADSASLESVEIGANVTFRLHQTSEGAYEIESLSPAEN